MRYRGRFAPSPTGPLHFGSLVAALASRADALANEGDWLLRIEDLDPPREQPGASALILHTLETYGFEWQGEVSYQSRCTDRYQATLDRLRTTGRAYPCACTRAELAAAPVGSGGEHIYPGTCRNGIPPGRQARAWRVRVDEASIEFTDLVQGAQAQDLAREVGDFIIRRADGWFAYQLAVVVDDALHGMTHIVRGADLLSSTPRQIFLQQLLSFPTPHYLHVPIVVNALGEKLSKQTLAPALPDADPLPWLHAAWHFLGQKPLAEAPSVAEFWSLVPRAWSRADIPRSLCLAADGMPARAI